MYYKHIFNFKIFTQGVQEFLLRKRTLHSCVTKEFYINFIEILRKIKITNKKCLNIFQK